MKKVILNGLENVILVENVNLKMRFFMKNWCLKCDFCGKCEFENAIFCEQWVSEMLFL